jgi:dihydroflavonol-4-reductase
VDVRDVADGHLAAWEKGAVGQRYILSAENLHNRRLVEYAVRLTGAKKVGRIPYPLAFAAAAFNEKIVARFKPEAADFNRAVVRTGSRYWYADARRSREALGVTYRPIDETALDTLRWSAQNGLLPITNSETRQLLNG